MSNNEVRPATAKQKALLKKLGYTGPELTLRQAGVEIGQLLTKRRQAQASPLPRGNGSASINTVPRGRMTSKWRTSKAHSGPVKTYSDPSIIRGSR